MTSGAVPSAEIALPWDTPVDDPVTAIATARAEHGDTFVVPTPSGDWWFVFDPIGVRSFYALEERVASKGVADWQMLRRKLPEELFLGRRTLPHDLFGRHATQSYLEQLRLAIEVSFDELGDAGVVDVFEWSRRLGHRMGLASWAGERPEIGDRFDELVAAFDALDGAAAFVDPAAMHAVEASDYATERAAMARIELLIGESIATRDANQPFDDLFGTIVERWNDASQSERTQGIARDVVLVHLGSMSNLFAALGWTVVHLLLHADVLERVRAEEPGLAERCALESTRIAQRSLMSRAVLRPVELVTELGTHSIVPPASIATLLPLTNTSAGPGLADYDPDRWERRRLRDDSGLAARELVATFGHGVHTCPAQPFSLAAIVAAATQLVDRYELLRHFDTARPKKGQIGGVARSATPCEVGYRRRSV